MPTASGAATRARTPAANSKKAAWPSTATTTTEASASDSASASASSYFAAAATTANAVAVEPESARSRKVSESSIGPAALGQAYKYSIGPASVARFPSRQSSVIFLDASERVGEPGDSRAYATSSSKVAENTWPPPHMVATSRQQISRRSSYIMPILTPTKSKSRNRGEPRSSSRTASPSTVSTKRRGSRASPQLVANLEFAMAANEPPRPIAHADSDYGVPIEPSKCQRSKFFTSFPFPHPASTSAQAPSSHYGGPGQTEDGTCAFFDYATARSAPLRAVSALVSGPRWLVQRWNQARREEAEEEANVAEASGIMERQALLAKSRKEGSSVVVGVGATRAASGQYGAITGVDSDAQGSRRTRARDKRLRASSRTSADSADSLDPYGYRALAGPTLLPQHAQQVEERRQQRQRWWEEQGAFQRWILVACAASVVLLILLALWFAHSCGWLEWRTGDDDEAVE
ncbi:hypothetical protein K437DRAFT_267640 [Tilletiaria anomala UBC 951]|uniref:Uncharacterized protein n=1 Tax=Tilletiaria anomala (strain ATCC 24038 / CBS 436.72 / UBC 951) TaxID=1037660 RepID=A0A066WCG2_TILAU|nr:uncharacterized protein K437DRAFT_267640 [Tilletiaria anomala UBC 951]KDN48455.1 hypothetical protein K437DRAFT_267640 [Tilletiaria anomala UBC 951]